MLIREVKLKCKKGNNGKYIWTFNDHTNKEQILLVSNLKATNKYKYGVVKSAKYYGTLGNRGVTNIIEIPISSPIKSDLEKFIYAVGVVLFNNRLKLIIQYKPFPNILTQESFDIPPVLSRHLKLGTACKGL